MMLMYSCWTMLLPLNPWIWCIMFDGEYHDLLSWLSLVWLAFSISALTGHHSLTNTSAFATYYRYLPSILQHWFLFDGNSTQANRCVNCILGWHFKAQCSGFEWVGRRALRAHPWHDLLFDDIWQTGDRWNLLRQRWSHFLKWCCWRLLLCHWWSEQGDCLGRLTGRNSRLNGHTRFDMDLKMGTISITQFFNKIPWHLPLLYVVIAFEVVWRKAIPSDRPLHFL